MSKTTDKLVRIRIDGTGITEAGKEVSTKFFKTLAKDLDDYSDISFTKEEAIRVNNHISKLQTGSTAVVPLICGGSLCQPSGSTVLTVKHGYVPIEDLDETKHKLWSWSRKEDSLRKNRGVGYSFKKYESQYEGLLCVFTTESGKQYRSTLEHKVIARWSEKAKNAFCVYLMQKGESFRIGKTNLFRKGNGRHRFSPGTRARAERADAIWILGVYGTNTEALLAEEKFSVCWQAPKALFLKTDNKKLKSDGLYRWVTQKELDDHHLFLNKGREHYAQLLTNIGLSIDCPIWISERLQCPICSDRKSFIGINNVLEIEASNFISGYMDMLTVPDTLGKRGTSRYPPNIEAVTKSHTVYSGIVYSLDTDIHHTYITDGIITHNCPFAERCVFALMGKFPIGRQCLTEVNMIKNWIVQYMREYNVDPENFTEVGFCNELAEIEIYLWRLNNNLAKLENCELVVDQAIGTDREGNSITQKQISPFVDYKERLLARRAKVIKLMVGDRESRYRKEAALKQKEEKDTSNKQADMRRKLEQLTRKLDTMEVVPDSSPFTPAKSSDVLTPDALMFADDDE